MRRYWLVFSAVAMVLGSGCQATGMGWIPSSDLVTGDKATFGFVFDGVSQSFSGSYHDPHGTIATRPVDVAFKGTGKVRRCGQATPCGAPGQFPAAGFLIGEASYQPQDPSLRAACSDPSSCLVDFFFSDVDGNGQLNMGDFVAVQVRTGPFAEYSNGGFPSGNVTVS